jgi:hypothetical protein
MLGVLGLSLLAANPSLATLVAERSLPGLSHQSAAADENAKYRLQALQAGLRVARDHTFGLGFLDIDQVISRGVDAGYLAHSAPGYLLVYLGWPGLIASILALLALCYESFRAPKPIAWMHPVFVASLVMMAVYGFGAAGLVAQEFVMSIGALLAAARFALAVQEPS